MSVSELIGADVEILVSDPWEFGAECGVGPFGALVTGVQPEALLVRLNAPIEYRGTRLISVVVKARHASGRIDALASYGQLAANLMFLPVVVGAFSEVTDEAKVGMVAAIGSVGAKSL